MRALLEEARAGGLIGPGPVEAQIEHARALAGLLGRPPGRWLDLGSGAGVPGLMLAVEWPEAGGVLLDASARRSEFARSALQRLGLDDRVAVRHARAEVAARDPELRGRFALVVARGFGRPAVTAECAVGFLAAGGALAVSEPPMGTEAMGTEGGRWPSVELEGLGLGASEVRRGRGATVAVMRRDGPVAERWPRRSGVPAKRPLW